MVFFACEIGQRFSNAFDNIDDTIGQFDWYLYPVKIKRMLPTLMINTQQPFEIMCFGSKACTRETCKKVSFQVINRKNKKKSKRLNSITKIQLLVGCQ